MVRKCEVSATGYYIFYYAFLNFINGGKRKTIHTACTYLKSTVCSLCCSAIYCVKKKKFMFFLVQVMVIKKCQFHAEMKYEKNGNTIVYLFSKLLRNLSIVS